MVKRDLFINMLVMLFSIVLALSSCDNEPTGFGQVTCIVSGEYHCEFLRWNPGQDFQYSLAFWGSDFGQSLDIFAWSKYTQKITKLDLYWDPASKIPVDDIVYEEYGFCWLTSWSSEYLLCSVEVGAEETDELWQINVINGDTQRIVTPNNQPIYYPDISQDGHWLTYCAYKDYGDYSTWGIWKVQIETNISLTFIGEPEQLTTGDGYFPRWSPDGNLIAYVGGTEQDYEYSIYTIPAEGGPSTQITPDGQTSFNWITWSPDGAWLIYSHNADLWKIPSLGGTPEQITDSPEPPTFPASPT